MDGGVFLVFYLVRPLDATLEGLLHCYREFLFMAALVLYPYYKSLAIPSCGPSLARNVVWTVSRIDLRECYTLLLGMPRIIEVWTWIRLLFRRPSSPSSLTWHLRCPSTLREKTSIALQDSIQMVERCEGSHYVADLEGPLQLLLGPQTIMSCHPTGEDLT